MTAYLYAPRCPIPSPVLQSASGSGNAFCWVWGAGIRANTLPIRITKIEIFIEPGAGVLTGSPGGLVMPLYQVDSCVFSGSSIAPTIVPVPARGPQAPPSSCTTSMSTLTASLPGAVSGQYNYSVQGTPPSGTYKYLGSSTLGSQAGGVVVAAGVYQFPFNLLIPAGSAFWIGSPTTPLIVTQVINQGTTGQQTVVHPTSDAALVAITDLNAYSYHQMFRGTNIYYDEVRLQPSF